MTGFEIAPIIASGLLSAGSAGIPLGGFAAASSIASTIGGIASAGSLLGTGLSAISSLSEGNDAKNAAKSQAAQLEMNANNSRATAQRQAIDQRKQGAYLSSRARALIAAGGGDASDSGSQDVLSGIDQEGEYRAMTALYNGEERARGYQGQADQALYEGNEKKKAGLYKAIPTILSAGKTISDRYG